VGYGPSRKERKKEPSLFREGCLCSTAKYITIKYITAKYREYDSNYLIRDVQKNFWGATEEMPLSSMAQNY
jgi:hypothetical protein